MYPIGFLYDFAGSILHIFVVLIYSVMLLMLAVHHVSEISKLIPSNHWHSLGLCFRCVEFITYYPLNWIIKF
ncbi:hypothetical protein BFAG_04495 [Bacteroides fragilis 3_1_12]|uniref:Uncharacterized protein n=1 Tax=Bacteroides fragilis 3_1_12 TaxID=457424 RepID=A0ABN0BSJ1_BACFG|nr:hypothetical protein BFAG_04495 [Bacteroides fragilis 3_1_12]